MVQELKPIAKTTQFLDERGKSSQPQLSKEFLDMTLKVPTTKEKKKDTLDFLKIKNVCGASQVALVVKNPPADSSILAWRISWTEEPSGLQSTGSQSQTRLKGLSTHG